MKILLFFPKLEPHKDFHHIPVTALAVSAELLARGHEVTIWDDRFWDPVNNISLTQLVDECDEIMISAFTGFQLSEALFHAKVFKMSYPNKKITLGGPHASALPEQTLADPHIDEVFVGEMDTGEHPLPYHLIDIEQYINPSTERFIAVTSYGCVGRCTFCATKNPRPLKLLPMKRVRADIDYLMAQHPFKESVFFDATLFTLPSRVELIAEIMGHYGLTWIADARAPEIARADGSTLEWCIDRGLKQLTIGLESGSPRVVDIMRKGKHHLEHFEQAARKLKQFPVKMVSGVVFGTPSETVEDLRLTIDYIKRIKEINPGFQISTTFFKPLPDTEMADMCREYGYKEPSSLADWAELGQQNHYEYNEFSEAPWIREIDEYRAIYEQFRLEYADLFA